MILEYCKCGCLQNFLMTNRKNFTNTISVMELISIDAPTIKTDLTSYQGEYDKRTVKPFQSSDLVAWSFQIASGMEYLASKRILHGDLAARNVLLTEKNVVKICDFGFSKQLASVYDYNYKKCMEDAKVPYKWMAIEAIKCGLFSTQSDCWSFGVVLWEIFSLGELPYAGMVVNRQFVEEIAKGYRMEKPIYAPSRIYDIMLLCWSKDPNMRPTFSNLVERLDKMLTKELKYDYLQLESGFQRQSAFSRRTGIDFHSPTVKNIPNGSELTEDSGGYLKAISVSQTVQYHPGSSNSVQQENDVNGTGPACSLL